MSDNIDYDELDKAVRKAVKADTKKAAAAKAAPKVSGTPKPAQPVARPHGHQYMDFVRRTPAARPMPASKPVAVPKPQPTIAPKAAVRKAAAPVVTPKPAQLIPNAAVKQAAPTVRKTTANMPQYRTAGANARAAAKAAIATPKPAAKTVATPKAAPKAVAAKKEEPANATIERVSQPTPKKPAAPNANNFSIGGKSPFLTNTQVEKTPLGKNPSQNSAGSIESTKNTYSQKSPSKSKVASKHIVTEEPKDHSGWFYALITVLVIAAGAGLGLLAWLIIGPNLGK